MPESRDKTSAQKLVAKGNSFYPYPEYFVCTNGTSSQARSTLYTQRYPLYTLRHQRPLLVGQPFLPISRAFCMYQRSNVLNNLPCICSAILLTNGARFIRAVSTEQRMKIPHFKNVVYIFYNI